MKRTIRILTYVTTIVLGVALMSSDTFAQNPDLSGTWTLNAEESELGTGGGRGGGRMGAGAPAGMTITHEGDTVTITTTRPGRDGQEVEVVEEIITDGEPHASENRRGSSTSTATWKDGILHVTTVNSMTMRGQTREFTTRAVYSLTGGRLIVERTREGMGGRGSTTIKAVYDQKD